MITRLRENYTCGTEDEDSEQFVRFVSYAAPDDKPTDDDVREYMRDEFSGHCGHEHDCCGCFFLATWDLLVNDGEEILVRLYFSRNV